MNLTDLLMKTSKPFVCRDTPPGQGQFSHHPASSPLLKTSEGMRSSPHDLGAREAQRFLEEVAKENLLVLPQRLAAGAV